MAYDFAPFGVYALKKSGIKPPKDLEGKKLGAPVFDAKFRLFPAFAKKNGITEWEHVNLTPQLREQSLVQGTVDFISGHYFSSMLDLKARGVAFEDIVAMRFVDFGMDRLRQRRRHLGRDGQEREGREGLHRRHDQGLEGRHRQAASSASPPPRSAIR